MPHYVPSYAIELRGRRRGRLVFSADCGPNDELVEFARGAELLLIEATLAEPDGSRSRAATSRPHEAGAIGRRAGVERLVLTHFSDQLDPRVVRARAEAAFGGPVELAAEGASYEI